LNELGKEQREVQKAVIVLSNSLHKLNPGRVEVAVKNGVSLSLKVSFLTFNPHPTLCIPNSIYLKSYRSLKPIIKILYLMDRNSDEFLSSTKTIENLGHIPNLEPIFNEINCLKSMKFSSIG
jgi:hypothetical protein